MRTTEAQLVNSFEQALLGQSSSPWAFRAHVREYDYISGKTDLLALTLGGELLAFEAKVRDWRRGLHQAWRNTSFVNGAYLVLPASRSHIAEKHGHHFRELGVGLCVVDQSGTRVLIERGYCAPLLGWLHQRAKETLGTDVRRQSERGRTEGVRGPRIQIHSPVQCRSV